MVSSSLIIPHGVIHSMGVGGWVVVLSVSCVLSPIVCGGVMVVVTLPGRVGHHPSVGLSRGVGCLLAGLGLSSFFAGWVWGCLFYQLGWSFPRLRG